MGYKEQEDCFTPRNIRSFVQFEHLLGDNKYCGEELKGHSFKFRQLVLEKDADRGFLTSLCKVASRQYWIKNNENKRIMPAEQRRNSSAISQAK